VLACAFVDFVELKLTSPHFKKRHFFIIIIIIVIFYYLYLKIKLHLSFTL